jgi:hypothetical protein
MAKKTVAKVSSKKISAPVAYKPTKGRPREHLAYLNQREMDYLRSINGNNMERGPRGLPSFPPDDAIGSSSKSPSGTSQNSNPKSPSGPSGPNSSASGTHSTKTSSGKSQNSSSKSPAGPSGPNSSASGTHSTKSSGSGSGGTGGGNKTSGGMRGAGSNYGAGSARPGSGQGSDPKNGGGYKGPSSPMGGQGSSFSTPQAAASYNKTVASGSKTPTSPMGKQGTSFSSPVMAAGYNYDKIVQQKAQTRDAGAALRNSPAVVGDLSSAGVRSLMVGPMGEPVNMKAGIQKASLSPMSQESNWADKAISAGSTIADSISAAGSYVTEGIGNLLGYQKTPSKLDGPLGTAAYDRLPQEGYYNAPKYGGPLGREAYDRVPQEETPPPAVSQQSINRVKEQYSMYKNPNAVGPTVQNTGTISDQFAPFKYNEPIGPPRPGMLSAGEIADRNRRMKELSDAPDDAFQGYDNYDPLTSIGNRQKYDPLSSVRTPSAPARPNASTTGTTPGYDPLTSVRVPAQQPESYDPLSSVRPPARPAPGYDPLSSVKVPPRQTLGRELMNSTYDAGIRIGNFASDLWGNIVGPSQAVADENLPYRSGIDTSYLPIQQPAPGGINSLQGAGYGTFNVTPELRKAAVSGSQFAKGIADIESRPSIDAPPDLPAPLAPERTTYLPSDPRLNIPIGAIQNERILEIEDVPPENYRPTYPAGTYTTPYDVAPPAPRKGMVRPGSGPARRMSETSYTPGDYDNYRNGVDNGDTVPRDENGDPIGPETPQEDSVSPKKKTTRSMNPAQDDYGDIQYPEQSIPEKVLRKAPFGIGALTRLGRFAGQKEWDKMSPEERLAMRDKWDAQNKAYGRNQSGGNDKRMGYAPGSRFGFAFGKGPDPELQNLKDYSAEAGGGNTPSGSRPAIYYSWDVGVNIPSPGDPNYNLYLQYLQERAAANAGTGG